MAQRLANGRVSQPTLKTHTLPKVSCPSIQNLVVRVHSDGIEPLDVVMAAARWFRAATPAVALPAAEPIAEGDEVLVDLVAFQKGRVVPMSARNDVWLDESTDEWLPGLRAACQGRRGHESLVVPVAIAAERQPWTEYAGSTLHYAVDIKLVQRRKYDEQSNRQALERAGLASESELTPVLLGRLAEERLRLLGVEVRTAVVDAMLSRAAEIPIPAEMITDELLALWKVTDGTALVERRLDVAQIDHARTTWLAHASLRAEIAQNLRRACLLAAVLAEHEPTLVVDEVLEWIRLAGDRLGKDAGELRQAIAKESATSNRMSLGFGLELAERFLVAAAEVIVVDAAGGEVRMSGPEFLARLPAPAILLDG
jgi:FKBP-type peptidyl-prolyl cis-trans isomerase (trigger factor)